MVSGVGDGGAGVAEQERRKMAESQPTVKRTPASGSAAGELREGRAGTAPADPSQTTLADLAVGALIVMDDVRWRIVQRTNSRFYIERANRPAGQETPGWIYRNRPSKRLVQILQ